MKSKNVLKSFCGALLLSLTLTGCETTQPQTRVDNRPRFHEGAMADVVLKFNRWDTIHLLRPDTREGGFLPILTRADVEAELKTQRLNRDLAVVVLGFLFSPELEMEYAREWDALLTAQGFKRVVVLRTGAGKDIDGLLVVKDFGIAAADEKQWTAAAIAALPPAAGANAANPSGR